MTSVRSICNCIGISGDVSIIKTVFGYHNAPGTLKFPGTNTVTNPRRLGKPLSLLKYMNLLKNSPHIRLHIKLVFEGWLTPPSKLSIDQMVYAMRELYGSVGIGVVIRSYEMLNNVDDLKYLDIGQCIESFPPFFGSTDEQDELFENLNNVPLEFDPDLAYYFTREIVIYLVSATDPAANGCAIHPGGILGAVIVYGCNLYTLSHEVGHLLGLGHVDDPNRLMKSGTRTKVPPDLTEEEVEDMKKSSSMFTC